MKEKWNNVKEKIDSITKFFLLSFMMLMGFWFSYCLAWFAIGLPQTNWAIGLLLGVAVLSELGYVRWLMN